MLFTLFIYKSQPPLLDHYQCCLESTDLIVFRFTLHPHYQWMFYIYISLSLTCPILFSFTFSPYSNDTIMCILKFENKVQLPIYTLHNISRLLRNRKKSERRVYVYCDHRLWPHDLSLCSLDVLVIMNTWHDHTCVPFVRMVR